MAAIDDIAYDFTALLRAGEYRAAARYWANDIVSVEPAESPGGNAEVASGLTAVQRKSATWFGTNRIDDLSIDGPFVTGDQFALFLDMMIVDRSSGEHQPFAEIALYTVRDGQICEERYFYD